MDPDDGGEILPRRSRRMQQLQPLPQSSANSARNDPNATQDSNESAQISDASESQYGTAHQHQTAHPIESPTPASQQHLSNQTTTSSDPPEDHTGISNHHPNTTQFSAPHATPNQHNPPQNISVNQTSTPPLFQPMNQSATSMSTQTSTTKFITIDDFHKIQTTVNRLENNIEYINTNLNELTNHTTTLQETINNVNNTMQKNITNAVVDALKQIQQINLTSLQPTSDNTTTTASTIKANNNSKQILTHSNHQVPNTNISNILENNQNVSTHSPTPMTQPTPYSDPITIADIINMTNHTKCNFPTYTKNMNIYEWKEICILELASSTKPIHTKLINYNANGNPMLHTNLSRAESQELFRLTRNALSTKLNLKFITVEMIQQADGIALWNTLIARFKPIHKDDIELADMTTKFTTFRKLPKEQDDVYIQRFEDKVNDMDFYGIKPTPQLQAVVFLGGLNEPILTDPIMQIRASPTSTYTNWIVEGNLKHTLERARNFIEQRIMYTPNMSQLNTTAAPVLPTIPNANTNNTRLNPRPPPPAFQPPRQYFPRTQQYDTVPAWQNHPNPMNAQNIDSLKAQFKEDLLGTDNKQDCIFQWRNRNKRSCAFHPGQAHKFFQCRVVQSICHECNLDHELHKAIQNSSESTRRFLAEKNNNNAPDQTVQNQAIDPNNADFASNPPNHHQARRTQLDQNDNRTYSQAAMQPPTPPMDYESGSNLSNSSYNSTNNQIDPYFNLCNTSTRSISATTSILYPNKTSKRVSFHVSVKRASATPIYSKTIRAQTKPSEIHSNQLIAITDSGASDDMSSNEELFEYTVPLSTPRTAILGDNKTQLAVTKYGPMNYTMNGHRIRKMGYLVPELGTTLLSIKHHMKYRGNYFHAENNQAVMAFPSAVIDINIHPEMQVNISPATTSNLPYTFDETNAILNTPTKRRKYSIIDKSKTKYLPESQHSKFCDTVRVKKLIEEARLPKRATPGSVGFDVYSTHHAIVAPHSQQKIHTGLAFDVPTGMYLRVATRSSMATQGINVGAGIIDNDYRGEVQVVLQNTSDVPFIVTKHSRIAQFVFEKNSIPCLIVSQSLSNTARGQGGFGSSSKSQDITFINRIKAKKAALDNIHNKQNLQVLQSNDDSDTPEDTFLHPSLPPVISKEKSHISSLPAHTSIPANYSINKSLPATASYNMDFISQSTGYYNNTNFVKYLPTTGLPNITIKMNDVPPLSDEGHTATMRSRRRNTTPSTTHHLKYSDIWHVDIGFGPTTAIGGIRYCLMLVDKATRMRRMYPLKNLTTSIHRAFQKFLTDVGVKPKLIRTDFDKKIIGSTAKDLLDNNFIPIESAPPKRQHQNGLVERAWQSAVIMSRNWLKSALLPSKYWFYALKRAIEISNISPTKIDQKITTPFEEVFHQKVDYRQLFPMFCTSYIKQTTDRGRHKNKWRSQSLKVICVGTCPDSDGLLFYHPDTKTTISCADNYKFDTYLPAGPQFGEAYDGRFTLTSKASLQNIHTAPSHEKNTTVYFKESPTKFTPSKILSVPYEEEDEPYIIQTIKTGAIHHAHNEELYDHDPTSSPVSSSLNQMYPWLAHDSKVTIALPEFHNRHKQGYLAQSDGDLDWYFIQGRNKTNTPILLSNFQEKSTSMIHNSKLFKGWVNSRHAEMARQVRITSNVLSQFITARHVSARDLVKMETPLSLLQHKKLHPHDKKIWDDSYAEEYRGLQSLDTWEVINEDQYKLLKKHNKARLLPTMAISVIKKDGDGNPQRAKYRIVVLGNMDPYGWEKHDCFAPVLAQFELRVLLHLAVEKGCIPKQGDVSQAFCQAMLPHAEPYIARPPVGCPITPKNAYWKLLKSLYGMKRSPRHWYDKCHKILESTGLKRSPNSPCVYSGIIIPGQPPLYLGLYVDDFIYFSESKSVEQQFEQQFAEQVTKVTYSHQVDYFLGIKFDCERHSANNVTINLSQAAFVENLLIQQDLHKSDVNTVQSPYKSGYPVDKIHNEAYDDTIQQQYTKRMQSIIGSLTWLSMSTRPDIATITNLLAKYVTSPSVGHIDAAKRVLKYLKGTKTKGLVFSTNSNKNLAAYIKFPLEHQQVIALTDANWGPQDQSVPKRTNAPQQIELFKSRSLSGFILWGNGPIHWSSKRQSLTARSTAEAEIIATDECVKFLLHMRNMCSDLNITTFFFPNKITVYNDNAACIKWSKNMTTKGLRYIQIRENAVREAVLNNIVDIKHIAGAINVADIFTKEDKDTKHFLFIRDILVQDVPSFTPRASETTLGSEGGVKTSP